MGKALGIIAVLVLVLALILFSAPSPAPKPRGGGNRDAGEGPFKAALVTKGAINDKGWSESAYNGLKRIEAELGASVSNTVVASDPEAFAAFRDFATRGNDLIIGHASEWFDPKTLEIAKANPKTTFLISGSERAEGNVTGVRFLLEDACYVLGQLASSMSRTGKLACVGPVQLPVIASTFHAFEQGAKSVKKDIEVTVVWTSSWTDVARAKQRAEILLNDGADFVFHNANDGGPGVFQAVQEKRAQGAEVYAFGSNADQNSLAEDVILASAVLDIPGAFLSVAKTVNAGTFKSDAQFLGMPEGFVWVAYNKKLESRIPPAVRKLADETAEQIRLRKLKAPRLELK